MPPWVYTSLIFQKLIKVSRIGIAVFKVRVNSILDFIPSKQKLLFLINLGNGAVNPAHRHQHNSYYYYNNRKTDKGEAPLLYFRISIFGFRFKIVNRKS